MIPVNFSLTIGANLRSETDCRPLSNLTDVALGLKPGATALQVAEMAGNWTHITWQAAKP